MKIHYPSRQLAVLGGGGRTVFVVAFTFGRVIESPMLDVALSSLHGRATHAFPGFAISRSVSLGKVQVLGGHDQLGPDPTETKLAISPFEGERVSHGRFPAIQ